MALVASLAVMNGGCLLIPQLKDRIVELALSGTATQKFVASGVQNVYKDSVTVDIGDEINVAEVLSDGGVDVSNVTGIWLSGVAYRISVADLAGARHIDAEVFVRRQGLNEHGLVTGFSEDVNSVTSFKTATLDATGVTELNNLLAALLKELKDGTPANKTITFAIDGTSSPVDTPTSFTWELKITISITGTVKVSVPT
jgi:hypothetical protein